MTNGWDFQVQRIELPRLGIDAGQELGMVVAQPEYETDPDATVPFRIKDIWRERQKSLIAKSFQIRVFESHERGVPVPFILFPETAIPVGTPDGLGYLREHMEQAEGDLVFVGGLEGLNPREARGVIDSFTPPPDVSRADFFDGTFINLCVIAIKSGGEAIRWYFQAKIRPSQWEQDRNMGRGKRVLHFVAQRVAFLCEICFDHIATQGNVHLHAALYRKLIEQTRPNNVPLDFIFVPQCNPNPNHQVVRQNTRYIFYSGDRGIAADKIAVVVVNKASAEQETSVYGRSGFHFKAGRWQCPTSDLGPNGYELFDLTGVTSAVFRKRTSAIHVATLVPASYNVGSPGNLRRPLDNPRSYLLADNCESGPCSCLPGTSCSAGAFVVCDCLPCKLRDALTVALSSSDEKRRWEGLEAGQTRLLRDHYIEIREALLRLRRGRAREVVDLLLLMHSSVNGEHKNPDLWSQRQFEAVVDFAAALSMLRELNAINFETAMQWTGLVGEAISIVVLDGEDKRYSWSEMVEKYMEKHEGQNYSPAARKKRILLVALRSRLLVEPLVKSCAWEFTRPKSVIRLGDADSFTKPLQLRVWVCQGTLFEGARQAETIKGFLETQMEGLLG